VINSDTLGSPAGKEHFRDRHGKEAVNDKVEPFQCIADRPQNNQAMHRGRL
jgi:hypothetical protein